MSLSPVAVDDPLTQRYEGLGLVLKHDSLTRNSGERDTVMPIFYEEHVVTWKLLGERMLAALSRNRGPSVSFLDVGTGSGIWTILLVKAIKRLGQTPRTVLAVDEVARAVRACRENLRLNGIADGLVDVRHEAYSPETAERHSVQAIFMNPPYHIYPPALAIENGLPQYASGGPHGYEEFERWLRIANDHMADCSELFFHHMCLGDESGPAYLRFAPNCIEGLASVTYYNILPRCLTETFLRQVYGSEHEPFVTTTAVCFPYLYFTSGFLKRDLSYTGVPLIHWEDVPHTLLAGRTWADRAALHRQIPALDARGPLSAEGKYAYHESRNG